MLLLMGECGPELSERRAALGLSSQLSLLSEACSIATACAACAETAQACNAMPAPGTLGLILRGSM